MGNKALTLEKTLYLVAFLLALSIRLVNLGGSPLSEAESGLALQAFRLAKGENVNLDGSPGYVVLTGLLFFIFGSGNFGARIIPAVLGSTLIYLPYSFRRFAGQKAALVMAYGLALDPGLVSLSRQANGAMIAIAFIALALSLLHQRKTTLAYVCVCLSLLSGTYTLHGLIGLLVTFALVKLFKRFGAFDSAQDLIDTHLSTSGLSIGFVTLLIIGTLFFLIPQGVGAIVQVIPTYIGSWFRETNLPVYCLILAILLYQPLAVVFGVIAAIRGWLFGFYLPKWLSLWFIVSILLALVYPGRNLGDIGWAIIPLWGLAALELSRYINLEERDKIPSIGQASLWFVLLALVWMNLSSMVFISESDQTRQIRLGVIAGSLALGAITTILVALGWSPSAARRGLVWGVSSALFLYVLAGVFGVILPRWSTRLELWYSYPIIEQSNLMLTTLEDLAEFRTGRRDLLDVTVMVDADSLKWLLRDWQGVHFNEYLTTNETPSVIIQAEQQKQPSLTMAYRGQDFVWNVRPNWANEGLTFTNWIEWVILREAPKQVEKVILWARNDLFPNGSGASMEKTLPPSMEEITPLDRPVE